MTNSVGRLILGFVFAPVGPCVALVLASAALAGQWNAIAFTITATLAVSLIVTLVCGVPLYLILRRYKSVSMIDCVVGGAAAALVLNLVLYAAVRLAFRNGGYSAGDSGGATYVDSHLTLHGAVVAAEGVLANLALGACIGLCFWLVALRPASWRAGVLR